jgi:hypothetical protein
MRLALAFVALALAAPSVARADVLNLYGRVRGGWSGGAGLEGGGADAAFREGAEGTAYGVIVGAEVVFLDAWVEHLQFRTGDDGLVGTWTQLMVGLDVQLDLGAPRPEGKPPRGFAELGFGVGLGLGTGQQVEPPLDNGEVTDKGLVMQGQAALGVRLVGPISLALAVPVGYDLLLKNGDGAVANAPTGRYTEVSYAALLELRVDLKVK